jgi:hypothetical protein
VEIIDNINRLLGDGLRDSISRGANVRIATSTFSIYAYEALQQELEGIKCLEFIFTAPTFVEGQEAAHVNSASLPTTQSCGSSWDNGG